MSVLAEFSIAPLGCGESVSEYVARATKIVQSSGLGHELHAMGTIIEADTFEQAMAVIGQCYQAVAADCNRVSVTIKIDARKGRVGGLAGKVARVKERLGR
ncbi:MAG: hypothetical protein BIFFINMI_01001 [Phycisphaerae bacterium]|nr:hypothetical protein [Phycisphaerae bacterium]